MSADESADSSRMKQDIDSVLTTVFSEDGKKAILFHMTERYGLTLEEASVHPRRLADAMRSLLGERGWGVVNLRILEQLRGNRSEGVHAALQDRYRREVDALPGSSNMVFGRISGLWLAIASTVFCKFYLQAR